MVLRQSTSIIFRFASGASSLCSSLVTTPRVVDLSFEVPQSDSSKLVLLFIVVVIIIVVMICVIVCIAKLVIAILTGLVAIVVCVAA